MSSTIVPVFHCSGISTFFGLFELVCPKMSSTSLFLRSRNGTKSKIEFYLVFCKEVRVRFAKSGHEPLQYFGLKFILVREVEPTGTKNVQNSMGQKCGGICLEFSIKIEKLSIVKSRSGSNLLNIQTGLSAESTLISSGTIFWDVILGQKCIFRF